MQTFQNQIQLLAGILVHHYGHWMSRAWKLQKARHLRSTRSNQSCKCEPLQLKKKPSLFPISWMAFIGLISQVYQFLAHHVKYITCILETVVAQANAFYITNMPARLLF